MDSNASFPDILDKQVGSKPFLYGGTDTVGHESRQTHRRKARKGRKSCKRK